MNHHIKKLAEDAGFIFWEPGEQGHCGTDIDWANEYNTEFSKFCELLIQRCAYLASYKTHGAFAAEEEILKYFNVKNKQKPALLIPWRRDYDNY